MTDPKPLALATIGYEGASLADFIATLKDAGVATLMDVREAPYSQREEFRKKALEKSLPEAGIAYIHMHAFGAPKEGRLAAKAGDRDGYKSAFARHLQSEVFHDALIKGAQIVEQGGACVMCLERDPKRCHRSIIAAVLGDVTGAEIQHLTVRPAGQLELTL